jgi:hypothetical protein
MFRRGARPVFFRPVVIPVFVDSGHGRFVTEKYAQLSDCRIDCDFCLIAAYLS